MSLARLVWSAELLRYDFGRGHPMSPARLDLTMRLVEELGLLDTPGLEVVGVGPAPDALLETVHDPAYVAAVRRASEGVPDPARGLGTEDDPVFPGMHEAAARLVAGSVDVAQAVWEGRVQHGLNIAGGMHHARRDAASGFCIYNDAGAAIQRLLDDGARRVAYIDLDAHHGDGVEGLFWDEPQVLTVSVHQDGHTLFPGTGNPADVGGARAQGTAVNVALPPRTGSAAWLRAVDAVVPAVVREFRPDVIVSQHGADAHARDPLSDLRVSVDAQRHGARIVHGLAHELCDGRWVALGGGGYAVVDVVPLVWSSLVAEALHRPLDLALPLPSSWRAEVAEASGLDAARVLGVEEVEWRPWATGYDPGDDVDRAVLATRKHVFPLWGLDPYHD
ncbi:acetoin utilization protein AcuC [Xylanimonas allomyrinae]|uniref:Acetoin utilization protein AcuC n=1 Tax=Xylanimonas allomyrinae TaxID=2509459 RepID=A0A4P6ENM5_9MICO|nr:acetoin utilization protein AcuC [Xylanimonas allomyrinae]QAY64312.1 acetoin utilization protein AcuC [Xylanimonas allomyrinae]